MSTWKVSGQSTDFTSDVEDLIESVISNASNWVETDPAVTDVRFGNDWWDAYGDYQVHIIKGRYTRTPQTNSWKMYAYKQQLEIHVFCKRLTEDKPAQWGKMERQIEKIVSQKKQDFGQGISVGSITGFEDMGANDNLKQVWHSMMTLEVWFWKVDTS